MKILLYKPDSDNAFRMYSNSCEVTITDDGKRVHIINTDPLVTDLKDDIIAKYELVKLDQPIWSDETKANKEIMVKLQVRELPKDDGERTFDDVSSGQFGGIDESPEHFVKRNMAYQVPKKVESVI